MTETTESLLTPEQMAEELDVGVQTILRWARENRIPSVRITPRTIRFDRPMVLDALKRRACKK